MGSDDWKAVLEKGIEVSEKILEWQLADAQKEYTAPMRISHHCIISEAIMKTVFF